jgi:hypothetical protein
MKRWTQSSKPFPTIMPLGLMVSMGASSRDAGI